MNMTGALLFGVVSDFLVTDLATLKDLESHTSVHLRDVREGYTLLSAALAVGKYSTSLYLLDLWPKAAAVPNANGMYPLHWAANTGIVSLTVAVHRAYPEAIHKMSDGKTPLCYAVDSEDIDTAKFLVSKGAYCHAAWMLATAHGLTDMLNFLPHLRVVRTETSVLSTKRSGDSESLPNKRTRT